MADIELDKIVLDPENEDDLVSLAYDRIAEASNGALTDFRPGSPIAALIEGQMFGIAELLYYLNQLPEALAIETFRLLGVTRNAGTQATGTLTFLLKNALASVFTVSAGYAVPYKDSYFVLLNQLVIPAGSLEGTVAVQSLRAGSDMNVPALGLFVPNPGINYLQSIYNIDAITGGSDLETLTATIARAQQIIRSHQMLVSATDYEIAAQNELGAGSRAVSIPFLNADKTTTSVGQVHLFLVDSQGTPTSKATCDAVRAALLPKCFVSSQLWVSPVELDPLLIDLTVEVTEISQTIADAIAQAVYDYLSPLTYPYGTKVKTAEIMFAVRSVFNVTSVDSVQINGESIDYLLANNWTSPFVDVLNLVLMQPDGINATYILGLGEGDLD